MFLKYVSLQSGGEVGNSPDEQESMLDIITEYNVVTSHYLAEKFNATPGAKVTVWPFNFARKQTRAF